MSGTGAMEIGAFRVCRLPDGDLVPRGGVVLPMADDSSAGAVANALTAFGRLTDLADLAPNALGLRPSMSMLAGDAAFVRLDAGLDFLLDASDERSGPARLHGNQIDGRLGVGVGVRGGGLAATLELVNVAGLTSDLRPWDERLLHTAAVSLGYEGSVIQPAISVVLPLDEDVREALDAVVAGSVQFVGLP